MVRTLGSHPGNTGSIPVLGTKHCLFRLMMLKFVCIILMSCPSVMKEYK